MLSLKPSPSRYSLPPHKTALLSKNFVLQFIIVLWSSLGSCTVKKCYWKFEKFHTKTPVLEFLFNKVAGSKLTLLKSKFFGNSRRTFFMLAGSIVNNMERINTRKGMQSTVQCSKCYDNFLFLSECHRLIIPLIFIFLSCVVKRLMITTWLLWKLQFCRENYESRPVKSNTVNISEQKAKMQYNCVYKNYKLE